MTTAILATRNSKKLRELKRLTRGFSIHWLTLRDVPRLPAVVENGWTFAANARKKALAVARAAGVVAVADDSGLEVDALDGAPGVRSARYAGARASDAQNNRKLLRALASYPPARRGAQFRCCIAVASPDGRVATVEGRVRGRIAARLSGRTGFGYDSVFIIPRYGRTFAALGPRIKDRMSHRARALRAARPLILRALASTETRAAGVPGRGVAAAARRTKTRNARPAAAACR